MLKSKEFVIKSNFNLNCVSYVFIYIVYSSTFVYLNTYYPILFFDVLAINKIIISFIQLLAYSVLLIRPIFASITDKYKIKGYQRKYYIIFSGYSLSIIYIFLGFTLNNILIFGIFLIFIYLSSTMLDVSTKSLIIDISPNGKKQKYNFFFILVGQALGRSLPFFLYFFLINDIYSFDSWKTLILYSYLFLLPLFFTLPFIKENNQFNIKKTNIKPKISNEMNFNIYSKNVFVLLCLFVFLAFSDSIFSYVFFPFLLNKFGPKNFSLFNFFLIFCFLISIMSSSIGSFLLKKKESKKIIFILMPLIGIIYILFTIVPFSLFTILYFVGWSLGTITNLNISVYVMKFEIQKKSVHFHVITSFRSLSIFIFVPLGTLLSNFIATEVLIIVGAILLNFSIIPLLFIKI